MHVPLLNSRRQFLTHVGGGFGFLAFQALLEQEKCLAKEQEQAVVLGKPHFSPRAKQVIFLFMEGGPSHIDLFDPKPELTKRHGEKLPDSFGKVVTPMGTGGNKLLASKRTFKKYGKNAGMDFSDWLPHMATLADEFTLLRACWADGLNHVGSVCQMNTGSILAGRASLGSWALYGLGTENKNLPGYIVLTDTSTTVTGGARNWGTGFMPSTYQGTLFRHGKNPILNLNPPSSVSSSSQHDKLQLLRKLNKIHLEARAGDQDLEARQQAYELAFRMQAEAPEAIDLSQESKATLEAYGLQDKATAAFGRQCLLARRLIERGVRFVQVYSGAGSRWDAHANIEGNHSTMCKSVDKPTAALIADLKKRGLLKDTLVLWGGEFGRTPMTEGTNGRDHNPYGFSMLMAGGGVKGGYIHGATDEFGLYGVEGKTHIHDFHATILHLLGLDHEKLTYPYLGREERLTITEGTVIKDILA